MTIFAAIYLAGIVACWSWAFATYRRQPEPVMLLFAMSCAMLWPALLLIAVAGWINWHLKLR